MGLRWTDEELEALERLRKAGVEDMRHIAEAFPHRSYQSINQKISRLRQENPEEWKSQDNLKRSIDWKVVEAWENEAKDQS